MQAVQRITADEYLALDLERTWLVDGVIVMNEPRLEHQVVACRLLDALRGWVRAGRGRGLAVLPLDVRMDDDNVYAPDVHWYRADRAPALDSPWPYPLADLAIEVRSPSTWRYDVGTKKRVYEREGLPELWLVDTAGRVVLVFRRSAPGVPVFDVELELGGGESLTSPLLPGFEIDIGALFDVTSL